MKTFEPDYTHIVDAARNIEPRRLPLYEHLINQGVIERLTGERFSQLLGGDDADLREYYRRFCGFYLKMGYDIVPYEICIGGFMPGSGALGGHKDGVIKNRADFERYPWDEAYENYWRWAPRNFEALRDALPPGMKAVGGAGNGVFECACDIVGYMDLCFIKGDDPELYADLFDSIGKLGLRIWKRLLAEYGDIFCVCRFGDDLGYKSATLISPEDIRAHVIPQYKKIIAEIHRAGKPFLLHSCGNTFAVMDDLIKAGVDAKHSNEDVIAPFKVWVERYGDRIGNFGGIDTDVLCRYDRQYIREYITEVITACSGHGGFAFSSGNSIPDYVPDQGYLAMIETVRELRGE